jgi:segregation and condensation protein B
MTSVKRKVEAVLYTTGKYMGVNEISEACGIGSVGIVKDAIADLRKEYSEKESSLEIQEHNDMFKLNIRKEYGFLANKLVGEGEFDSPTIKTLAVIAYKSPIIQSDIIKIRGNKAYDHISSLKENGLVNAERSGRSRMLKLTNKFFEYFDVAEKEVKEQFGEKEEEVRKNVAWKMGTTPEHVGEIEKKMLERKEKEAGEKLERATTEDGATKEDGATGGNEPTENKVEEKIEDVGSEDIPEKLTSDEKSESNSDGEPSGDSNTMDEEEVEEKQEEEKVGEVKKEEQIVKVGDDGEKYVYDGRGRVIGVMGD